MEPDNMSRIDYLKKYNRDVTDLIADYWRELDTLPPLCEKKPGYLLDRLPLDAPENPDRWEDVVTDIKDLIVPGMPHFSSPNFHGYIELGTSAPSIAASQLEAAFNTPNTIWKLNPASTELEMRTTDWLGRMIGLPDEFLFSSEKGNGGGVIQESASGSTILMLVAAKSRAIKKLQEDDPSLDPYDVSTKLVAFTSDQAHSCIVRAGMVTGIRTEVLPTDDDGSLRGDVLQIAVDGARKKGRIPIFLGSTLGTTTSCAIDNLSELGPICKTEGIWLHVDAAYTGPAFICQEFRYLMNGVEFADSFNCAPQKTLLVTMNCSVLWVKDRDTVEGSLSIDPPYMVSDIMQPHVDYRHWSMNFCRPFRSLKLWFVIRLFGASGLRAHIRKKSGLLNEFAELIRRDERFEICAKVVLEVVCFRLKYADNETNKKLMERINERGKVFIHSSLLKGRFVLRFVVCNAFTESCHVTLAYEEIQKAVDRVEKEETLPIN